MNNSNKIEVCKVKTYVKVEALKTHPQNPRTITPERLEQLKASILKKGFYEPILVWKKGGVVLSGNHRLQAARELIDEGYEFVTHDGQKDVLPVVIEDIDYKTAEAILFEANNHYADWVEDKLKKAIQEAQAHGSEVSDFGFSQKDLNKLLKAATKDADEVLRITNDDIDRELGPKFTQPEIVDPVNVSEFELKEEEFGYLTLPKKNIDKLRGYLVVIAKSLDPSWNEGSLSDASDVLIEAIRQSGIIDDISKGNSDGKEDD